MPSHKRQRCVAEAGCVAARAQKTERAESSSEAGSDSAARQLLGIRGGSDETDIWKIRLQLTKPVTWVPLIWGARCAASCSWLADCALRCRAGAAHAQACAGSRWLRRLHHVQTSCPRCRELAHARAGVGCGAAASGHYQWNDPTQIAQLLLCMVMSGPLLTGYTQTMNDWYDREIDAINEPNRPIPSGRISATEVIAQIWVLLGASIGVSYVLDRCAVPHAPRTASLTSAPAVPALRRVSERARQH